MITKAAAKAAIMAEMKVQLERSKEWGEDEHTAIIIEHAFTMARNAIAEINDVNGTTYTCEIKK